MGHPITKKIKDLLDSFSIEYKEVDHEEARTCEESALARGEPQEIGGKTILFKNQNGLHLFTLSASLQVDSKKVREILNSSQLRFATPEELLEHTGVEKGALPPFGSPIYPFNLYVDESILKNSRIAFNAGQLTKSIIMDIKDWQKCVTSAVYQFSK